MKDAAVESAPDTYDRELDLAPEPPADTDLPIAERQRLIVNPFLTLLGWTVMVAIVREGVLNENLYQFIVGLGLLFLSPIFLQFHCLDCRKTGWLLDYRQHACPDVLTRAHFGSVHPWRGPRVKAQLIGWSVLLVSLIVLGLIAWASAR
jgi:hypothetical protein